MLLLVMARIGSQLLRDNSPCPRISILFQMKEEENWSQILTTFFGDRVNSRVAAADYCSVAVDILNYAALEF